MFKLIKYSLAILLFGFIINALPDTMFPSEDGVKSAEDTSNVEEVVDRAQYLITSVDWVEVSEKAIDGLSQVAMMLSYYLDDNGESQESVTTLQQTTGNEQVSKGEVHQFEQRVHELVNQERKKQGLDPLKFSVELSEVARAKSQDMADKNYFDHVSPTYGSPFEMMKEFGVHYWSAGENIAMGQRSPEQVMEGWMNSPGHRKNILHESFTHIGVGFVKDNGTYYWTQMFIGK